MVQGQACNRCSQGHDCKKIYQQLGQAEGPSVVFKVLMAFALPVVTFLAGLAAFGHLLRGRVVEPYQTPVAIVLALLVTTAFVLGASLLGRQHHKAP
jgi:hypothetical protein